MPVPVPDPADETAAAAPAASASGVPPLYPPLLVSHVLNCQYSSWHALFRDHSPRVNILKLDPEFVAYLKTDRVVLPKEEGDSDDDTDEEDEDVIPPPSFPSLSSAISSTISTFRTGVFPKLNWSAPLDAAWISPTRTLKCVTPSDVYLLLKSSDFIAGELAGGAFEGCIDVGESGVDGRDVGWELVLKKWFEMPRSHEFRCFVRDDVLLAISQRDPNFYAFLQEDELQSIIRSKIISFWEEVVRVRYPDRDYVFDVYLTRDRTRLFLIDFNPFSPRTDTLLFSPQELYALYLTHLRSPPAVSFTPSASPRTLPTPPDRGATPFTPGTESRTAAPVPVEDEEEEDVFEIGRLPELRVIDHAAHPAASQASPVYGAHMVPKDVVDVSEGRGIEEFARVWNRDTLGAALDVDSDDEGAERGGVSPAH